LSIKKRKIWISYLGIFLFLIFSINCKKKSPTTPNGDSSLTFSGTISLNGQPFAGVNVYLSGGASQRTTTAADGKFTFSNLLGGTYLITPSRMNYQFNPSSFDVGSQSRTDLNITASDAVFGSDVGEIAANFTLQDQNGDNVSLYDYHGNVILMDFTADWCGPCREKAETAEEFFQQYKDKGFMYILIVIEGDPAVWAETYGLTFPVLNDNGQTIYNVYRQADIPLPHVIDRNCTIRYKKMGFNKAEVEAEIKKYL